MKEFEHHCRYSLAEETKGLQWTQGAAASDTMPVEVTNINGLWQLQITAVATASIFIVPAEQRTLTLAAWTTIVNANIEDWDTFHHFLHSFYIVQRAGEEEFSRSCPIGVKRPNCKHIVGIRYKYFNFVLRNEAKQFMLGTKRARGRPRKIGYALDKH